jgi:hypothetical protein
MAEFEGRPRASRAVTYRLVPKTFKGSSHITLQRAGYANYVWAFHDNVEIGPKMLARIAKHTGLKPEDL